MKFDKNRVYTAVNAEDLPIGSICIYADTLRELRKRVQEDSEEYKQVLVGLHDDSYTARFMTKDYFYSLAYFIEDQSAQKYKPFENVEKAMEAIKKHGGWVRNHYGAYYLVTGYNCSKSSKAVFVGNTFISLDTLFKVFMFVNDGSPCGKLEG